MGGVVHQLVFQLDAHNGPALLVGEALHLAVDFPVPQAGFLQVAGVVVPQGVGLLQQPVWEAAVAALAVGPGADAYHRLQARPLARQQKGADVPVAGEVEPAFLLLVVNPEQVGGHHGDAAGFHLAQLPVPVRPGAAGEVELSHNGDPGLAVPLQVEVVHVDAPALGVGAAQVQVAPDQGRFLIGLKGVPHISALLFKRVK